MKSMIFFLSFLFLSLLFISSEGKNYLHNQLKHERSNTIAPTYTFTCAPGFILRGRSDWTDQQVEGTAFLGFTCCPESHPDLLYLNENYFCCPKGSGGYCMSNSCNCKNGGALKGGKVPKLEKIA